MTSLRGLTQPYAGTTSDGSNVLSSCGSNTEKVHYIAVAAGAKLDIGQASNTYDSKHELRWGGACPGSTSVQCTDDPDTQRTEWTNTEGATQVAYFIVDAYSSGGAGNFSLTWSVAAPAALGTDTDLDPCTAPVLGVTYTTNECAPGAAGLSFSKGTVAARTAQFASFDANSDGAVSAAEFRTGAAALGVASAASIDALFTASNADSSADGLISAEFAAIPSRPAGLVFASSNGADTALGSCTAPVAGVSYTTSVTTAGSTTATGTDSVVATCTAPSAAQYVTVACVPGSTTDLGTDTQFATAAVASQGTSYVETPHVSGSTTRVGCNFSYVSPFGQIWMPNCTKTTTADGRQWNPTVGMFAAVLTFGFQCR